MSDEVLFKKPPPQDDCPICSLRLPSLMSGRSYRVCCGKELCVACFRAPVYNHLGEKEDPKCPFCRTSICESNKKHVENTMKRVELADATAIYNIGCYYRDGDIGDFGDGKMYQFPQDIVRAIHYFVRAGELGCAEGYYNVGVQYENGNVIKRDLKMAKHYYKLAAIGGDVIARFDLGCFEKQEGIINRALRHWHIAAECGHVDSLHCIREMYSRGYATKDDYGRALQAYSTYLDEVKSDHRDRTAASHERFRYI